LNGELDTGTGAPTFLCALVRHIYPNMSASLGAGLHYDRNEKLHCTLRAKKAFPVASSNRFVNFVLKGRCDIDQELNQPKPQGALELVWNILDFQKDQDVRLKVGYELVDKIPYVQLRENNWTFNADITGRWNWSIDEMSIDRLKLVGFEMLLNGSGLIVGVTDGKTDGLVG
ncbi:outer envelope pore protein 21B, chloroplastic, partial [Tanacetum coccineum]